MKQTSISQPKCVSTIQQEDQSKLYLQCDSYSKQLNLLEKIMSSFSWYQKPHNLLFKNQIQMQNKISHSKPQQQLYHENKNNFQYLNENKMKVNDVILQVKEQDNNRLGKLEEKQCIKNYSLIKVKPKSKNKTYFKCQKTNKSSQNIFRELKNLHKSTDKKKKENSNFSLTANKICTACSKQKCDTLQAQQILKQDEIQSLHVLKAQIRVNKIEKLIQKLKKNNNEQNNNKGENFKSTNVADKELKSTQIENNNQNHQKQNKLMNTFSKKIDKNKTNQKNSSELKLEVINNKTLKQQVGKIIKNKNKHNNSYAIETTKQYDSGKQNLKANNQQQKKTIQRKLNLSANIAEQKIKIEPAYEKKKYLTLKYSQIIQNHDNFYDSTAQDSEQIKQSSIMELPMTFFPKKCNMIIAQNSQFTVDDQNQKLCCSSTQQNERQYSKRKNNQQNANKQVQKQIYTANSIIKQEDEFDISQQSGRTEEKLSRQTIDTFHQFNNSRNPTRPSQIQQSQSIISNKKPDIKISQSKYSRKQSLKSIVMQKYQANSQNIKKGLGFEGLNWNNFINADSNILLLKPNKRNQQQSCQKDMEGMIPTKFVYYNIGDDQENQESQQNINKDPYLTMQSIPMSQRYSQNAKKYEEDMTKLQSLNWKLQSQIKRLKYRKNDWRKEII